MEDDSISVSSRWGRREGEKETEKEKERKEGERERGIVEIVRVEGESDSGDRESGYPSNPNNPLMITLQEQQVLVELKLVWNIP